MTSNIRAATSRPQTGAAPPQGQRSEDDAIKDEHFLVPILSDRLTRPEEPWFDHLRKFVDQGAAAFKMDGSNQVLEHPDRKWGNGMCDEEMHNLYPVLLAKQMNLGFREHTGRRPMIYSAGGFTGVQQYAATWAGDTGGGSKPLVSLLNHGLSRHSNTSCDMDVYSPEGIHFGFLQPWSQINGFATWEQPWFREEHLCEMIRFYARLRYRLLPYLYSMAHVAAQTGMPMVRAMPLVFPEDPKSDELLTQYMLGEAFLTAAFTDEIHLPEGRWIDYWTGQRHEGPEDLHYQPPEGRGGPLFVRAGAIIPTWPDMDYVGHKPLDTLGLHVYPHGTSEFTFYEDDGITCDYLDGALAQSRLTCQATEEEVLLIIGAREGRYEGMREARTLEVFIHVEAPPATVELNDRVLLEADRMTGWHYDTEFQTVRLTVAEPGERQQPAVVRCQWK